MAGTEAAGGGAGLRPPYESSALRSRGLLNRADAWSGLPFLEAFALPARAENRLERAGGSCGGKGHEQATHR